MRIQFVFATGLRRPVFSNVRLVGSWDNQGRYAPDWSAAPIPMAPGILEDGCAGFTAGVDLDAAGLGQAFQWGLWLDAPRGKDQWGIVLEVQEAHSTQRIRSFVLDPAQATQVYYFSTGRRLGAQKRWRPGAAQPGIEFSVWAPKARAVDVVFGLYDPVLQDRNSGYIDDAGGGIDTALGHGGGFPLTRGKDGLWRTDSAEPLLADFSAWANKLYVFRVTKADGSVAYNTDLCSRCQIGQGNIDPQGRPYHGSYRDLDGSKSCSVVTDPDTVAQRFSEPVWPETAFEPNARFWAGERSPSQPLPTRLQDLFIYELHVGSLGFGQDRDGDFSDVEGFLDHLVALGVNTVELLPVLQYEGTDHWGYGTSHPYALDFSAGGRDQLKHVIRSCHRRGLAVIMDVVYNHYHVDSKRAEWAYDSNEPQDNLYYWYEGHPQDYPAYEAAAAADPVAHPPGQGGYLDNDSTGFTPRFWEETLRHWYISSAVALLEEFHVDGFRVDLPQALYQFNVRHGDGVAVDAANAFGAKFLREWTRTLKLLEPGCFLIAEDHSGGSWVTQSPDAAGLGFDATWDSAFYHHLIGDGDYGLNYARVLYEAGFGDDRPLAMGRFAQALALSGQQRIVYHKDHDEVGNAHNTARTLRLAVNNAPLDGSTRAYAEARSRVVFALAALSAGTPMFVMGEEIASINPMPYQDFRSYRDDFPTAVAGDGSRLFAFYQTLIRFRLGTPALCSRDVELLYTSDADRVIVFLRREGGQACLVVASLNNHAFDQGYWVPTADLGKAAWKELLNSDATVFGGNNVGNGGATLSSTLQGIRVVVPANGVLVFKLV